VSRNLLSAIFFLFAHVPERTECTMRSENVLLSSLLLRMRVGTMVNDLVDPEHGSRLKHCGPATALMRLDLPAPGRPAMST